MAISNPNTASNAYTDLSALNQISVKGREDTAEGLKAVAKQFEAMFLNIVLKSMRESNKAFSEGSYLSSNEMDFYQQNFDDQMSVHLSEGKGIGLAENLYRQLLNQFEVSQTKPQQANEPTTAQAGSALKLNEAPGSNPPARSADRRVAAPVESPPSRTSTPITDAIEKVGDVVAGIVEHFSSPAEFIDRLYPSAKRAAARIGVDPEVLLAQSALETGWGKKIVHDRAGNNSHNLFGIKADPAWAGEKSIADTVEYSDGLAQREQASFRRYQSYQESFDDYVRFLQSNPRYSSALDHARSASAFAEKLQDAGYATDPVYAEKISSVLNSPVMQQALSSRAGT